MATKQQKKENYKKLQYKPYTNQPITTTVGTETRPDVFNPEKNRYESTFTDTERLANQELQAEQQKADVEKLKMQNKPVSPEMTALAEQQATEQQATEEMLTGQPQASVAERNVQAGQATINSIIQTLGGEATPIEEQRLPGGIAGVPGKALLTALGKVTTVNIPFTEGFSLSDLFSKSNAGNIKELNSDAQSITGRARLIYADATSRGGDQRQAIEQLKLSEEAVRQRYNDAKIALSASPQDIAEGVDFTEEMYSNLVILQSYRFALERQQLTGEKNQALLQNAGVQ